MKFSKLLVDLKNMAKKRVQKNPAIFYDRIFTHFLTIPIFVALTDADVNIVAPKHPQKVDVY